MPDAYPIFVALDATALEAGRIYIGAENTDPEMSPINVYWDEALTVLATQPLLTSGGVIVRDGTPAQVYASSQSYSIRVRDRSGAVVWYKPVTGGALASSRLSFPIPTGPASTVPGPSNNTRVDLATLKAANIADLTSLYSGSLWTWTLGNFTGQADDINVVKANSTALTVGAWVRQKAAGVSYGGGTVDQALNTNAAKLSKVVYVTDPPYNVTAALTPAQQSAGIMAAVNANKGGTIIIPAHLGLTYSGIILIGSTYNNTRIVVEDDSLFQANPNPANGNFQTTIYCMFAFNDCDGCSLAIPGSLNGNRTNQAVSQQQPLIMIAGATNFTLNDGWTAKEVRGDAVTILKKTLADPTSKNSDTIYIGGGIGTNSADDGRNLVSLISGSNVTIGACTSINIGGTINGERMPGGWDCEPDHNAGHYVSNVTKALWLVKTAGTSGSAWIGASQTGNDTIRDWNIVDVHDAGTIVIHTDTTSKIGGPIIRRVLRGRITADLRRSSRNAGIDVDYADFCDLTLTASGCSTAVVLGFLDMVIDSIINITVTDHSASAVLALGVQRCEVRARTRNPQGTGSYGLNITKGTRTAITQTGVRYTLDCPFNSNLTFAIRNDGVEFGPGTVVTGGSLLGYPSFNAQLSTTDTKVISTEGVQGRNYAGSVPTTGTWASDDFVKRIGISGGASPGWYSVGPGAPNFKAAAAVAA